MTDILVCFHSFYNVLFILSLAQRIVTAVLLPLHMFQCFKTTSQPLESLPHSYFHLCT